jgi:phage tail sheath protein FI
MPEYLAPGVYVEEISAGPPPIAGVGTTTTGMVGLSRRGPTSGRPQLVTNYGEFVRTFGGPFDFGPTFAAFTDLPHAVRGFFANGGRRLYISRVVPTGATGATAATATLRGGLITRLTRDVQANSATLPLVTVRGIRNGSLIRLQMTRDGITTTSPNLTVTDYDRVTGEVDVNPAPTTTYEARYTTVLTNVNGVNVNGTVSNLANPGSTKPATFGLIASSVGSWGHDVRISVAHRSAARSVVQTAAITAATNSIPVLSTAGFYPGAWVEVDFGTAANQKVYRRVNSVIGSTLVIDGPAVPANAWNPVSVPDTRISSCEFDLALSYVDPVERTTVTERYAGLTLENVPGRYYVDQLVRSTLVSVDPTVTAPAATNPFFFPSPADGLADTLGGGGLDGTAAPTAPEVLGSDLGPNQKTGLLAMQDIDEVAILAAPGITDLAVQRGLVDQCERLMDRFAVLDPVPGTSGAPATLDQIQSQAANFDTRYAALYYPRVVVTDPTTGLPRVVAPSGHMIGVYARVDNTRGVHKAPANEVINGIVDLETFVSKAQHEILNPRGINVLRDLRADRRGLRVYGARCLTSEQDWIYVNVRRLFIFIEESLDEGTQWAVFEPNDYRLWQRLRDSVSIFLTGVWRDGALMGERPEEAFFVICDRSTMGDDDILNGRLIMEIGIAPVRPSEFVIIRIGQWLGGSSTQEL